MGNTKQPLMLDYYNFSKIYSYNGIYNFLVGARGLGKTYGAKKQVIKNFFRDGQEFIYLRRYKDEMKAAKPSFFADIGHEFPDWDFRVNGTYAECAPVSTRDEKKRPWRIMGYFVSLSTAQTQKSIAFPLVRTIIFDEFIIEKGHTHYLPREAIVFTNFFSTVDRYKDKTRVFFLANSVSIENPYFLEYDIKPDEETEFFIPRKYILSDGQPFMVCHFADSASFSSGVMRTKFGQFIKDTEYADYAIGNEFADNNDNLIARKHIDASYMFTLETMEGGEFSVWVLSDQFFMQQRRPKQETRYTMLPHKVKDGVMLMETNSKLLQYLRSSFKNGNAWFDEPVTRNAFIQIFKR